MGLTFLIICLLLVGISLAEDKLEFEIVHDTEIVETITKIANRWGYGT